MIRTVSEQPFIIAQSFQLLLYEPHKAVSLSFFTLPPVHLETFFIIFLKKKTLQLSSCWRALQQVLLMKDRGLLIHIHITLLTPANVCFNLPVTSNS